MIADPGLTRLEIKDPLAKLRLSAFPGNSNGTTSIPNLEDPSKSRYAGDQPSSWSSWYQAAKSTVLWPFKTAQSAYETVKNAPGQVAAFVAETKQDAAETASAFASWTKWIVVGLIALAVVYVVGFAKSVAPGKP